MQMKCSTYPSNHWDFVLVFSRCRWNSQIQPTACWLHLDLTAWIWFWAGGGARSSVNDNSTPPQQLVRFSTLFCAAWPSNLYIATGCIKKAILHQMTSMKVWALITMRLSGHVILMVYFYGLFHILSSCSYNISPVTNDASVKLGEGWKRSSKFMENTAKRDSHALFSPFLSVSRNGHEVVVVSVIVEILHFQWEREAPGSVFTTDSESAEIPAIFFP